MSRHNDRLTLDEHKLLALLCDGLVDKEIARRLGVTQQCVSKRVRALCVRLGARTRVQAIHRAHLSGVMAGYRPPKPVVRVDLDPPEVIEERVRVLLGTDERESE